jgi:pSer/pThr/pTyr-binding forkhead associated (FHA) protein/NADPH-dependent 2,4-dienoyl-CoA reductase/sulfur reductase-like enzyme
VTRYAIIGDGGAGTTAAFYIRQSDPNAEIEIFSDDPNAAYYRAALTNYLIGELREAQLFATPPDFYHTHNIKRTLTKVVALDVKNSRFTFDPSTGSGQAGVDFAYDQLLIACGARPNPPDFIGANISGVMTMRTLQDARFVMDSLSAKRIKQAVVVGGGPLGIEWVQGLLHHQVRVTYLLRGDMFFERALDKTASDLVISRLRAEGVDVVINEEIGEAIAGRDGKLRAIRLKNSGKEIECQLVGAAIGIRPNVEFLEGSDVEVAKDPKRGTAQGIKVNEMMRTNIENIYAAGDILYRTLGLWEPARLQGRVAGKNMAGDSQTYKQGVHYNATRLYDLDFASVGEITPKDGDQALIDFPKGSGQVAYRKLILRENKLIGAIMLGQRKEHVRKYGLHYRKLINEKLDVSSIANNLIDSSFDLASWLDSQQMDEQINSAKNIVSQSNAPSIADIRMTKNVVNVEFFKQPDLPETNIDAVLLYGNSKIILKKMTSIGRKPENDLALNDSQVSSQHAQIKAEAGGYILEDVGSTNGTFVNKVKINKPTQLASGALIKIGETQLQFMFGKPAEDLRMTSAGLPEAPISSPVLESDSDFGYVQVNGRDVSLQMLNINIGRDVKAEIVLDDSAVSYKHALLTRQGNDSYLLDLGSRNGTFVNAERISTPHLLKNGDVIKLGETSLTYRSGSAPISKREIIKSQPVPVKEPEPVVENKPLELAILVQSGNLSGKMISLKQSPTTLGRDPKSQIVVNEEVVSWNHAEFKKQEAKWFIKDMGSSNHTFINEEQMIPHQYYPIKVADKIRFGKLVAEVVENAN